MLSAFILLEVILRLAGGTILLKRDLRNKPVKDTKGTWVIMCLGESTTACGGKDSYPSQLEEVLNEEKLGVNFRVINRGRDGTNSAFILAELEKNLDKYHPDIVVTMMGINDSGFPTIAYEDTPMVKLRLFLRNSRVYKLFRLLVLSFRKMRGQDRVWEGRDFKEKRKEVVSRLTEALVHSGAETDSSCGIIPDAVSGTNNTPQDKAALSPRVQVSLEENIENLALGTESLEKICNKIENTHDPQKKTRLEAAMGFFAADREATFNKYLEYRDRGDMQKANSVLEKAIEEDPGNKELYSQLATSYIYQGRYGEAEQLIKKALELGPYDAGTYALLGQCYTNNNRPEDAEKVLEKSLQLDPYCLNTYQELYRCYALEGRLDKLNEACSRLEELLEKKPDDEMLFRFTARFYRLVGDNQKAEQYFEKAKNLKLTYYNPLTRHNYRKLKDIVMRNGIYLVCVQYPTRSIQPLKKMFDSTEGIIFVDNEKIFKDAIRNSRYGDYFSDNFAGDFGHATRKGNRLLARNIAKAILKEIFAIPRHNEPYN